MSRMLEVTSHVARDLLQSAALFRQPPPVIWEYVANGLQYVDPGVAPVVKITASARHILVEDNGRGMSLSDLAGFFTMHGENEDRRQGRPGRGTFGTGKSAAFAIAGRLRVNTVKAGRRCVAELARSDLESATHGGTVPVQLVESERSVDLPNGTRIEIDQLKMRVIVDDVRRHLERHLRHWRRVSVFLNGTAIEPPTPAIERTVVRSADRATHPLIQGCTLSLHVARGPLHEDDRGVAILSSGVLHELTLAGAERKEFSQYIFGEIDVPQLGAPHGGVDAFDMARSGHLNRANAVVIEVIGFIGAAIEALREELVQADRERRRQAEQAKLQAQADEIARVINADYADFAQRFKAVRSSAPGRSDLAPAPVPASDGAKAFLPGGPEPAIVSEGESAGERTGGASGSGEGRDPAVEPAKEAVPDATGRSGPAEQRPRRSAGFDVRYEHDGTEANRCHYAREHRRLTINLDHPQIAAALGSGPPTDPGFRRLSYEVAVTEYAVSLARENATAGFYNDLDEPLVEVRERIDAVSRRVAHLFATG